MHIYTLLTTILLITAAIRIFQLKGEVATTDYWRKKANEWESLQKFTDKNLRGECDMWIAKINDKDTELLKAHADLDNLQLKYDSHVNGVINQNLCDQARQNDSNLKRLKKAIIAHPKKGKKK